MKKLIILLIILSLASLPISSTEKFASSHALFEYWENTSYPEYVCGVWSTKGGIDHLTIAVNSKGAEDEILALLENDSSVAFAYQKYSKNYLLSIIDEMNNRFDEYDYAQKTGFVWMALDEYENRVDINFEIGYETNPECLELVNELTERFGDAVKIGYSEAVITYTEEDIGFSPVTVTLENEKSSIEMNLTICCVILAVSVLLLSCAFVWQSKRGLRLSDGRVKNVEGSDNTEELIKNSIATPTPELDKKIMDSINKNN